MWVKRLAAEFDTTVGNTVALAVRALRQDHIGRQLQSDHAVGIGAHGRDRHLVVAGLEAPQGESARHCA